jgi:uncharacterized membrane protein YedE/YeeE
MNTVAFVVVLFVTTIIGYAAERSRFCSVSGIRDYFLFHDTYLAYALPGIFVGSLASFAILSRLGYQMPGFPLITNSPGFLSLVTICLTVVAGVGIGFYSILADGCPLRQHVRAAMGRHYALAYLLGFYAGILYFYTVGVALLLLFHGLIPAM